MYIQLIIEHTRILKSYLHNGKRAPLYWYRDIDKKEIDLLIERDATLYPVEIKLTGNPDLAMVKNFNVLKNKRGSGAILCLSQQGLPLADDIRNVPIGFI